MGNYFSYQNEPVLPKKYGWKKDKQDYRDYHILFKEAVEHATIDLREKCPEIYDQGQLGSCTANAIAFAYEFDQIKQKEESYFTPSRLLIYYNERDIEGNTDEDTGASMRDGIKSINSYFSSRWSLPCKNRSFVCSV